jgi:hypothetical protein
MTWMGLRDAKPQKGGEARTPFLGPLVTVVTVSYFIEPMGRKNAKRMHIGGMQVIVLLGKYQWLRRTTNSPPVNRCHRQL